jgi:hypothetical protein
MNDLLYPDSTSRYSCRQRLSAKVQVNASPTHSHLLTSYWEVSADQTKLPRRYRYRSTTIETGQLRLQCVARKVPLPDSLLKWCIVPGFSCRPASRHILVLVDCSNIIDEEAVTTLFLPSTKRLYLALKPLLLRPLALANDNLRRRCARPCSVTQWFFPTDSSPGSA